MLVLDPDSQQAASSFPGLLVYFAFSASEKRARSGTTTQTFELSKNGKIPGEGAAAASAIIVVVLQRRQKRRSCGHSTIIIAQISYQPVLCRAFRSGAVILEIDYIRSGRILGAHQFQLSGSGEKSKIVVASSRSFRRSKLYGVRVPSRKKNPDP